MIEIRQVREDELDEMLAAMSTAFGVKKDEWADDFYLGRAKDPRWKRILLADGKIVSALEIIPAEIYLGGTTVPMGGIGAVSTLPDHRRHGCAGALVEDSVRAMREMGFAASTLYPFSFKYYRKFGWELASHRVLYYVRPELLPAYAEASRVRPFKEVDLPAVMRLYEERYRSRCGPFVRDEDHWRRHIMRKWGECHVFDGGGVEGYLIAKRHESDGEKRYRVDEMVASTDEARRGLIGFLAGRAGEVEKVNLVTSAYDLAALGLLTARGQWEEGYDPRCEVRVIPSFQFRVVDLAAAMKALSRRLDALDGELTIMMEDQIGEWNDEPVTVKGPGEVVQEAGESWIKADVRIMSQVYIGYLTPSGAVSQGKMEVSSPEALRLADEVFPESEPSILRLDEF